MNNQIEALKMEANKCADYWANHYDRKSKGDMELLRKHIFEQFQKIADKACKEALEQPTMTYDQGFAHGYEAHKAEQANELLGNSEQLGQEISDGMSRKLAADSLLTKEQIEQSNKKLNELLQPAQEPVACPYPCGWDNLYKITTEKGAYLVSSFDADNPMPYSYWQEISSMVDTARTMVKWAMQLYTHPAPQPAPNDYYDERIKSCNDLIEAWNKGYEAAKQKQPAQSSCEECGMKYCECGERK